MPFPSDKWQVPRKSGLTKAVPMGGALMPGEFLFR